MDSDDNCQTLYDLHESHAHHNVVRFGEDGMMSLEPQPMANMLPLMQIEAFVKKEMMKKMKKNFKMEKL